MEERLITGEETVPPDPDSETVVKKVCRNCGEEFETNNVLHGSRHRPKSYCSIDCYREKINWTDDE